MNKVNLSNNGLVLYLDEWPEIVTDDQIDTFYYWSICCFSTGVAASCVCQSKGHPPSRLLLLVCLWMVHNGREGKRRDFWGEVWKGACCIDCVWVVNRSLLGSMVEVIKQRCRQDVVYVRPAICSTLTCCCGCKVEGWEAYSVSQRLTGIVSKCCSVCCFL